MTTSGFSNRTGLFKINKFISVLRYRLYKELISKEMNNDNDLNLHTLLNCEDSFTTGKHKSSHLCFFHSKSTIVGFFFNKINNYSTIFNISLYLTTSSVA